jgi:FkbM family methyltransferase
MNIASFSPQHESLIKYGPYETVLHIGANIGQELSLYNFIGVSSVIWIEPDKRAIDRLKFRSKFYRNFRNIFINAFISEKSGETVPFYKFSKSGANSRFKPTFEFLESNKSRYLTGIESIKTLNIEDALHSNKVKIINENNLLVIDVQGSEASVLNGFNKETLGKFRIIMCEFSVNQYEDVSSNMKLKSLIINLGYKEVLPPIRISDDAIFEKI